MASTKARNGEAREVIVLNGDDEALGAKADSAAADDTGTYSLIALTKRLLQKLGGGSSSIAVAGTAADGAAASGNPVLVAGVDGSGNAQTLATETNGQQRVTLYSASGTVLNATTPADALAASVVGGTPLSLMYAFNGATFDRLRHANVFKDMNAVAIGTIATVWTPAAGKKFRLLGGCISVSAAASVLFEDNAAAAFVYRTPKLLADTPLFFTLGGPLSNGFLSAAANNVLKATSSAAANITGVVFGTEE